MAKVGMGLSKSPETDPQARCCQIASLPSLPPVGSTQTALFRGYVCDLFLVKESFLPGSRV